MRGRHRLAALCGVLCLLVSACGGSAKPQPLPRPTASLSPSASPTPPVMPAAAKEKTKAGAEAVVRHFIDALNFSGRSGDTTPLRGAYTRTCTRCEAIADGIDRTHAQGGSYAGGDWIPRTITFYTIENGVAVLDAAVDYTAQTWIKKAGAQPTEFKASANHLHAFQLQWVPSEGWRVGALDPHQ